MKKFKTAFSLIELSIVILIIGILVAGVTQSSRLVKQMRLNSARAITQSSAVSSIKNLVVWFEPTLESSFASLNDGDVVALWNDNNPQSTQKNNLVQATSGVQPTYVTDGIGGLPSLKFNVAGNFLRASGLSMTESYTIFTVFSTDYNAAAQDLFNIIYDVDTLPNGNAGTGIIMELQTSLTMRALHRTPVGGSGGDSNVSTSAISLNKNYILSYVRNFSAASATLWFNNTAFIGGGATTPAVTGGSFNQPVSYLIVGVLNDTIGARNFSGMISEMLIFDRALKQSEIDDVEAYLSKKYGVKLD